MFMEILKDKEIIYNLKLEEKKWRTQKEYKVSSLSRNQTRVW